MHDVTVLIPAYNEAKSIASVIGDIRRNYPNARIVIGDNNSIDNTAEIARKLQCFVVPVAEQGKGATIRNLVQDVMSTYTMMTDADGTYPVGECVAYFRLLLEQVDIVVGYRKWLTKGSMSRVNRLGNIGLNLIASVTYLRPAKDLCSGLWGFRTDSLKKLPLSSRGFELEADMYSCAVKLGMSVEYVPIPYFPRVESVSHLKIMDGVRIAGKLIKNRIRN